MRKKIAAALILPMILSAMSAPASLAADTAPAFEADVVQTIENGEIKGSLVNDDQTLLWTGVPYACLLYTSRCV